MNPDAPNTVEPEYFSEIYAASADPWNFETSWYEKQKYLASLAALPRQHYDQGFEIGGSIGILTRMLGGRCRKLLSVDVSTIAQRQARTRCADQPHIEFMIMQFPRERPTQTFDLIVLSEVGYYLCESDLLVARNWIIQSLEPGGHLLLVHWTPFVKDYPLTGDEVHDHFLEATPKPFKRIYHAKKEKYRIDVLKRFP
jgi:SAM-dependent methyltransferase